jgi:hypothetical protein
MRVSLGESPTPGEAPKIHGIAALSVAMTIDVVAGVVRSACHGAARPRPGSSGRRLLSV